MYHFSKQKIQINLILHNISFPAFSDCGKSMVGFLGLESKTKLLFASLKISHKESLLSNFLNQNLDSYAC